MRTDPDRTPRRRAVGRKPHHRKGRADSLRRPDLQQRKDQPPGPEGDRPHGRRLVLAHGRRVRAPATGGRMKKQPFHNFVVHHMTFLTDPDLYKTTYALFRIVFGVSREDLIYEKRSNWPGQKKAASMTFASRLGVEKDARVPSQTIVAVVQPTEPADKSSHARPMLQNRAGACAW